MRAKCSHLLAGSSLSIVDGLFHLYLFRRRAIMDRVIFSARPFDEH